MYDRIISRRKLCEIGLVGAGAVVLAACNAPDNTPSSNKPAAVPVPRPGSTPISVPTQVPVPPTATEARVSAPTKPLPGFIQPKFDPTSQTVLTAVATTQNRSEHMKPGYSYQMPTERKKYYRDQLNTLDELASKTPTQLQTYILEAGNLAAQLFAELSPFPMDMHKDIVEKLRDNAQLLEADEYRMRVARRARQCGFKGGSVSELSVAMTEFPSGNEVINKSSLYRRDIPTVLVNKPMTYIFGTILHEHHHSYPLTRPITDLEIAPVPMKAPDSEGTLVNATEAKGLALIAYYNGLKECYFMGGVDMEEVSGHHSTEYMLSRIDFGLSDIVYANQTRAYHEKIIAKYFKVEGHHPLLRWHLLSRMDQYYKMIGLRLPLSKEDPINAGLAFAVASIN